MPYTCVSVCHELWRIISNTVVSNELSVGLFY